MKFGDIAVDEAAGAVLAHSVRAPGLSLKKGLVLRDDHIDTLRQAGVRSVIAAKLEPNDIDEDTAATRLAAALTGPHVRAAEAHTGRVNLFSTADGVLRIDPDLINALNGLDESITVATLEPFAAVADGQMVATIKIIPLSAPGEALARCETLVNSRPSNLALAVLPYRARKVGLVQSRVAGTKESVLDKTRATTDRRLAVMGMSVHQERRCGHRVDEVVREIEALKAEGCEILLLIGASAIIDRRDVLPAAVEASGGTVERFGMPVDPGNLLMLAHIGTDPVLGLPGCARSIKLNGFDWILQRLAADVPVSAENIGGMGVGGLLTEIPTRPQPRQAREMPKPSTIAAIVLAAGQSRRMGPQNKLLETLDGKPLVARAVEAAIASRVDQVIVVTGHQDADIRQALASHAVRFVHCPDADKGLARSLQTGIEALGEDVAAAVICLGDMPFVHADGINALIEAYDPAEGNTIIVTTHDGKRGNPVLWDRRYFAEMTTISGDVGARHLIGQYGEAVREVPVSDALTVVDIDTPEALAAARIERSG